MSVPRVSSFYGITIKMFFNEDIHPGRPHFHAEYAEAAASFEISSLIRLGGVLPTRVERLVKTWARAHQEELMANWERAQTHQPLEPIDPLQ
jgi:hypothetical protein